MKLPLTLLSSVLALTAGAGTNRVYFGTSDSKGIYFADFDSEKGGLSEPKLALEIGRPGFLSIHPNKHYLYSLAYGADLGKAGGVAAMKINPDGTLQLLNTQATEGRGGCHVSIDQSGQCLMAAYYGSGSVASFRILEDGSLSEAKSYFQHEGSGTHPQRQDKPHAHSIFPNPENTHAYVADLGIDKIMIYKLDAENGKLSPAGEAVVPGGGMGPRHLKFSGDGKYAYVLNELDLSVSVFKSGANGSLELITTVSALPEQTDKSELTCAEIRIHPNGNFIYASTRDLTEQGRDSITVFSRFEDGFERIGTFPAEVWIPRNFNIDPSGKWLLAGGKKSFNIALFRVDDQTGSLTFTGTKVPFDGGPICIEFLD